MTKIEYQIKAYTRLQELRRRVDMAIGALDVGIGLSQPRIDEINAAMMELKTLNNKWRSVQNQQGETE